MSAWHMAGKGWLWVSLFAISGASLAQIYTWTDADGKKHFGDAAVRPKNSASPEIKVPPPNVVDRFEARKAPEGQSGTASSSETLPLTPPAASQPTEQARRPSGTQRGQDSCKAKWDAFDSASACYAECGKSLAPDGGRNNAACGHCTDVPMPRC